MATLVQPRSTAMATQMPAKPGTIRFCSQLNLTDDESMKMGTMQMLVATHESTEKATGVLTCWKTSLVSSVFDTATVTSTISAFTAAEFSFRNWETLPPCAGASSSIKVTSVSLSAGVASLCLFVAETALLGIVLEGCGRGELEPRAS